MLFTSSIFANAVVTDPSQPMASMPFAIFTQLGVAEPHDQQVAWAAALVLMAFVLLGSIIGRLLSAADTPADRADAMILTTSIHPTSRAMSDTIAEIGHPTHP